MRRYSSETTQENGMAGFSGLFFAMGVSSWGGKGGSLFGQPKLIDDRRENEWMDWHALRVRSRYEQVVKRSLHGKEHEQFLPTYRSTSQWSDRLKLIDRPLFPGYIFSRSALRID